MNTADNHVTSATRAAFARESIREIINTWGELRRQRHTWCPNEEPWPIPEDALRSLKVEVEDMQREIEKHG